MKKYLIAACSALLLFASCAQEFNNVYKSNDYLYKYEYAKEAFANGKYNKAITILQSIVTQQKGTKDAEDCLYMLAMSEYMIRDYATASEYFKKYYQSYPKGAYAEQAEFYVGESLYMSTPEPRLDQTPTYSAIAAYQEYLDLYPDGSLKEKAQSRLFELQDKLVEKEYLVEVSLKLKKVVPQRVFAPRFKKPKNYSYFVFVENAAGQILTWKRASVVKNTTVKLPLCLKSVGAQELTIRVMCDSVV